MVCRDQLMDTEHFEAVIADLRDELVRHSTPLARVSLLPGVVSAMYSAGHPVGDLRPVVGEWLVAAADTGHPVPGDLVYPMCFGLLLGVEEPERDLLRLLLEHDTRRMSFPAFLADCLGLTHPPVQGDGTLWKFFPKVRAIEDSAGKSEFLGTYLTRSWYNSMRGEAWWGSHRRGRYVGYWAWEIAATVRAYGLDDSGFCDSRYYPKDLAHFLG